MKVEKRMFWITISTIFLSALSLVFLMFLNRNEHLILANVLAAIFWVCFVAEIILYVLLSIRCKKIKDYKTINSGKQIGVISFFKNKIAIVFDILTFISAIMIAVLSVLKVFNGWLLITSIILFYFSFNLHCFFNGKIYRFLTYSKQEEIKNE